MATMTCCSCGDEYIEDDNLVLAWADSGESFEPTDWECIGCRDLNRFDDLDWFEDPDFPEIELTAEELDSARAAMLADAIAFAAIVYRPNIPT
jgi:hypothetical protein